MLLFGTVTFLLVAMPDGGIGDSNRPEPKQSKSDQDAASDVARRIQERVEQLQVIRERQRRMREAHSDAVGEATRQIDRLRGQLSDLDSVVAEQQRTITDLEGGIAESERTAATVRLRVGKLRDTALSTVRQFARRVETRIPLTREGGNETLRASVERLESQEASDVIEGIRSFVGWIGEEWKDAASLSLTNQAIELEGGERRQHVWMFRLGLASAAWISEDGWSAGLWSGDPKNRWRVNLSNTEFESVRDLFDVARGRSPPAVVPLPCRVVPARVDAPRSNSEGGE